MKIGVLALQGDFDAHRRRLEELGAEVVLIKKPDQLDAIDGLVIPGGESGTFLKLLGEEGFKKLKDFVHTKPTFGTCAGAILLAAEVENPKQAGLGAQHPHPPQRLRTPDRQLHPPGPPRRLAHRNGFHSRP
jgi:5'-phosphate synthase pdxT subunit